jgi:telomerase reverse transcriptase
MASLKKRMDKVSCIACTANAETHSADTKRLIKAKQYEPISLHSVIQDIKLNDIGWLKLEEGDRVTPQEAIKRRRMVEELLVWIFDSVLVPLLKVRIHVICLNRSSNPNGP